MRLVELHVEGFGILHDYYLGPDDLQADLTVVFGLNEAGKSTLLSFIRAVLFGFKHRGEPAPEALAGGRLGGHLVFEDHRGGRYRVERTAGGSKARFRLILPDGSETDESVLGRRLLQNLSYPVFKNVFAFGMDELRQLENLKQDEIGNYIYGAGTGIEPRKLTAAVNRLRSEMDGLFMSRGRSVPELNRLAKELGELETELRGLRDLPARYRELKEELAAKKARRMALQDACREKREQIGFLDKLLRAGQSWKALGAARAALRDLPVVDSFPESGVERLEDLEERVHKASVERDGYLEEIEQHKREMKELVPEAALLAAAEDVRELAEQRSLLASLIADAGEAAAEARRSADECAAGIDRLGPGWSEERLANLDTSIVIRQQIEEHRGKLEAVREREKTLLTEVQRQEENVTRKTSARDEARSVLEAHPVPETPGDTPLEVREQMLDRLEADTRRLAALQTERKHLHERKGDLTGRMEALVLNEQALGAPLPVWAAPLTLALVMAAAAVGFMLEPLAALSAVVIGVPVAVAVEIARRRSIGRRNRVLGDLEWEKRELQSRLSELEQDINRVEAQAETVAQAVEEAAGTVLGTAPVTDAEIMAARHRLAEERRALEKRNTLEEALTGAQNELDRERERLRDKLRELEAVRTEKNKAEGEWKDWLQRAGLDPGLEPAVALSFIDAADRVRELIRTREDRKQKVESLRRRIAELVKRADQLARSLGFAPVTAENAGQSLREMREAVDRALAQEKKRQDLIEKCERLQGQVRAGDREIARREQEIRELLETAGAADREDFRRRAAVYARRRELQDTIKSCERDLSLLAGSSRERDRLDKALAAQDPEEYAAQLERTRIEFDNLEQEREDLDQEIGRVSEQLAVMEAGDRLAAVLQKREMLRARFNRKAGEWQVRALALRLLERAKEKYERERQPAVLARASEYLRPMTADRYRRVIAPVGQTDKLEVERGDGTRLGAAQLSRGTAAQLLLSVRLALARQLAETNGAGLPLILDDILVDFDGERLKGAARVLGQVAGEQQVMLFTCHRHILETVTQVCPNAAAVHL